MYAHAMSTPHSLLRARSAVVVAGLAIALATTTASAQTVTLGATRSNTLFEDPVGLTSSGASPWLFAGATQSLTLRRGLLFFDVASALPTGAVITSVTLQLHMSRTVAGIEPVSLHRVNSDWGSGVSNPPGQGGTGAQASQGDATWLYRFFDESTQSGPAWATPGGDFDATALATTAVGGVGFYQWSSEELTLDVVRWAANPTQNFGWLVQGTEGVGLTAKRFDTQFAENVAFRPQLVITYIPTPMCGALLTSMGLLAAQRRRIPQS